MIQSVSLLNRLISNTAPNDSGRTIDLSQSLMYSLLVKSISQQNSQSSIISGSGLGETRATCESKDTSAIAKNNQFLVQLNLMKSQATASISTQSSVATPEINWFYLLVSLAKHKSSSIMDCMLFSLFRKIAQLTPCLFGTLLGTDYSVAQMNEIVLRQLRMSALGRGQVVSSVCEFLVALVVHQPGYFQMLAAVKSDSSATVTNVDESKSVLKALFDLLADLKKHKASLFL